MDRTGTDRNLHDLFHLTKPTQVMDALAAAHMSCDVSLGLWSSMPDKTAKEEEGFTCFGQTTSLITCARTTRSWQSTDVTGAVLETPNDQEAGVTNKVVLSCKKQTAENGLPEPLFLSFLGNALLLSLCLLFGSGLLLVCLLAHLQAPTNLPLCALRRCSS